MAQTIEKPLSTRQHRIHVVFNLFRIGLVIVGVHMITVLLERHGVYGRVGRTGEYLIGSVVDHLLFGLD
jgi:hypothetical protein